MEKEVVNQVNRILASSLDLKLGIRSVYAELKKIWDCERMTIALFEEDGKGFRYFALEKDYEAGELVSDVLYPMQGTHFERIAKSGEPEIIDNAEGDSWVGQKLLEEEGIRSALLFPLEYKGRIIGTVNFGSAKPKHFSEDQFNLLRQIAPGLAISIQNVLLFRETQKRLEELTILHGITKVSTSASLTIDQMLREIVDNRDLFKFEYLDIFLIEENTKRLIHSTRDKSHRHHIVNIEGHGLCLGKGITGWVAEKGEPLLVNDATKDPRYAAGDESIRSEICVPLKVGQKVIGVIDAQSTSLDYFTQNDLRLLNIAAGQIASLIENSRLQKEIKRSEEKYRTVVEGAIDGVCVIGKDHLFKYVNERLAEIHGYRREELIGTDFRNLLDDESRTLLMDRESKLAKGIKLPPHFELNSKGDVNLIAFVRDITDRKQAEIALRKSEEKYRTILQSIQDAYFETDLAGNITFFNDVVCRHLGYTRKEFTGMGYRQYTDQENAKKLFQVFNRVYRTGEPAKPFEVVYIRKDGTKMIGELSLSLIRDSEGKPIGFRAISRDITERKQMEEALRESENKFRNLVENSIVGVYLIQEGIFKYVNAKFAEIHGYEVEEMVGKMGPEQTIFPEDRPIVERNISKRGKGEEQAIHYGFRIVTKHQEIRYVEIFGSRTMYRGRPAVIGTMLDITGRKKAEEALRQSEERYRNILESMEDGYYEVNLAGSLTFFNGALCRIYGYTNEEMIGLNYRQSTTPENAKKLFQTFNEVYRTGEPGKVLDWEIIRKDGTRRHVEASVSLQRDVSSKAIGFRGILRDITEKKKVEEQLFQTEKLRAVGEMASGVAHDFNNALAAILGNTQLLLHTTQDEEIKETLKIIEKVAKDSSQTVRRLQDFTRRRVDQELFKVDINAIISDFIEITKPKWKDEPQSKGVHIDMVLNLEEIPFVSGTASELREVIANMIFNAIEAMPEGGKIEIHTSKKGKNVRIQISDTGTGIPEETKKKILEPFFTTKPFTHTGLGLSMSYGIIKRFGGEIEIESELGQGTTFTIILPVGGEEKEETVFPQAIPKGRQAQILVIDDDEFVRNVLSRTLAQDNHQVTLAENGEKGIEIFKEGKFDMVLTDLGLPGMSGWEVCKIIKEISPKTPVGMITGWGVEKDRREVKECGLDFFISKPFDFDQILNVVSKIVASEEG